MVAVCIATHYRNIIKTLTFKHSPVLRGLMSRPTDKSDRYLNYGLTNRLFKSQEEYLEREEIG